MMLVTSFCISDDDMRHSLSTADHAQAHFNLVAQMKALVLSGDWRFHKFKIGVLNGEAQIYAE